MALEVEYLKERHPVRWIIAIILLVSLGVLGWLSYAWYTTGNLPVPVSIVAANNAVDETDVTKQQIIDHTVGLSEPRYIRISSFKVDQSRVYPAGLDENNLIETQKNIHDISWYKDSSTPGGGGVILMEGHSVGSSNSGSFSKLSELEKGDTIILVRGDGKEFTYSVVENESLSIDDVTATGMKKMGQPVVESAEGLNLITNDGNWVPKLGMFDRRIMLRATIVDSL